MAIATTIAGSSHIVLGGLASLSNQTQNTISLWVNPTSIPTTGRLWTILTETGTARALANVSIAGVVGTAARRLTADALTNLTATLNPLTLGIWNNVTHVLDWAGQLNAIYVNGVLATSIAPASWTGATTAASGVNAFVGTSNGAAEYMNASFQHMRIYRRALTGAEIAAIWRARGADRVRLGIFNDWKMNNGIDGVALGASAIRDYGPGVNNASGVNNPVWAGGIKQRPKFIGSTA